MAVVNHEQLNTTYDHCMHGTVMLTGVLVNQKLSQETRVPSKENSETVNLRLYAA